MERIQRIISHSRYRDYLERIRKLEENRIYCGHDMIHFLDVARIAYIFSLEQGSQIPKEQIYAAALLHDIGRFEEYLNGIPHEEASARLAAGILQECGFGREEAETILTAIALHRTKETGEREDLAGFLYRADKRSRSCFFCEAADTCNWKKKNEELIY